MQLPARLLTPTNIHLANQDQAGLLRWLERVREARDQLCNRSPLSIRLEDESKRILPTAAMRQPNLQLNVDVAPGEGNNTAEARRQRPAQFKPHTFCTDLPAAACSDRIIPHQLHGEIDSIARGSISELMHVGLSATAVYPGSSASPCSTKVVSLHLSLRPSEIPPPALESRYPWADRVPATTTCSK